MKTIIHIGQHKTGTTSIQKFLQSNKDLCAENGLYIPSRIAGYEDNSHFILNVYALDENRYSSKKEDIVASKGTAYMRGLKLELQRDIERTYKDAAGKGCTKVIWSNEGLYLLNSKREYERLVNLFSEYSTEVEVVCCFRDKDSYRQSYTEQLKKGKRSESNDPDSYRYLKQDSWLFDYDRKKTLLSSTFDKHTYFLYDATDNVGRFMESIGITIKGGEEYRENVTTSKRDNLRQRIRTRLAF